MPGIGFRVKLPGQVPGFPDIRQDHVSPQGKNAVFQPVFFPHIAADVKFPQCHAGIRPKRGFPRRPHPIIFQKKRYLQKFHIYLQKKCPKKTVLSIMNERHFFHFVRMGLRFRIQAEI
jgi:hypothetical protein